MHEDPRRRDARVRRSFGPLRRRLSLMLLVLLALFLTNTVVVLAVDRARDHTASVVGTRLAPARLAVQELLTALVDQANGAHDYALTHNRLLRQPYDDGLVTERAQVAVLRRHLAGNFAALEAVTGVETAAARWRSFEQHVMDGGGLAASAVRSKELFDAVRDQVSGLTDSVNGLQQAAAHDLADDDSWLIRAVTAELVLALVVAGAGVVLLRRWLTRPLEDLVASIESVGAGELGRPVQGRGPKEFVQVGEAVDAMRRAMLHDASEMLNRSVILAAEDQRRRLAADIHDDPTQALTAVSLRLQRLHRRLTGTDAELLADAETAVSSALGRLRRLIFDLYTPTLDEDGLAAAVTEYMEETLSDTTDHEVVGDADADTPAAVLTLAFRLTRSALLNVAKHAGADRVTVTIEQQHGRLDVTVVDDGVGFDVARASVARPGHLGLPASAQFATSTGGGYEVSSEPGRGTTVHLWLVTDAEVYGDPRLRDLRAEHW